MECPKCGRAVPPERPRCIYCGAGAAGASPSAARTSIKEEPPSPGGGRIVLTSPVGGEEGTYVRLDHLPESLRKKVEEVLRAGEGGPLMEENGRIAATLPEERERPGGAEATPNLPPGFRTAEEYVEHQLALMKSERKAPLNKVVLTFILFASMAFGGFVVWFMR